jgi:hypothetical protein
MLTRTTMTIEIDLPLCPDCPIKVIPKKGDLMDYQAAELAQQIFKPPVDLRKYALENNVSITRRIARGVNSVASGFLLSRVSKGVGPVELTTPTEAARAATSQPPLFSAIFTARRELTEVALRSASSQSSPFRAKTGRSGIGASFPFTSCCRAATANRQPMRQTRAS